MDRLSEADRQDAVAAYLQGERTAEEVAKRYGVSVRTLRRWVACHRYARGLPTPGQTSPGPVYDAQELQRLRDYALAYPQASHRQLLRFMTRYTGKSVHKSTLADILRRMGLSGRASLAPTPEVRTSTPAPAPALPAKPPRPKRMAARPAKAEALASQAKAPPRYQQAHRPEPAQGYPTDLREAEWQLLQPHFVSRGGRPPEHPPRLMLNAIFYVLRSGCPWRMLPHDFPPWKSVYTAFRRWTKDGRLSRAHDALRRHLRRRLGRKEDPSALIVDSQSVKTTEKGGLEATTGARRSTDESATSPSIPWAC
jgi:transposase/transposase-like protein